MANLNYEVLQNGSDIRGIALSGVKGEMPNLTRVEAARLSKGFLLWLSEKAGKSPSELTISIGYDSRLSAKALKQASIDAMLPYGTHIFDCGLASTPAMFMSTVFPEYKCDGAIMITASHLPFNRNGFKYFDKKGGLNKSDISQIIAFAESDEHLARLAEKTASPVQDTDLIAVYSAFLREKIKSEVVHPQDYDKPLSGLKIIVDAGNGSGGFYARQVLAPLGADISKSQFLEPDGTFPNHPPNPEDKEAMKSISMAVLTSGADLGIIFDTDVDRAAAVDALGFEISRNRIVAMAAALIAKDHPGTTVVTDSITSDQLSDFLTGDLGLKHLRFKRGYKNVINEAIRLNEQGIDSQLAIETSGHAAFKENHFLDDGAYLATKIVIKTAQLSLEGKKLNALIAGLKEPVEAKENRLPIAADDFSSFADQVLESVREFACAQPGMTVVKPNYEGICISFDKDHGDGWCLLRKSLHDPIMPLNIESNMAGGCEIIRAQLLRVLKEKFEFEID